MKSCPLGWKAFTFEKTTKLCVCVFFAVLFFIILKTFRDYGITWDEEDHQTYGKLVVKWYLSFIKDGRALQHPVLVFYGGFFDVLAQVANRLSPWGVFETRHFLGALLGYWTIFMCFSIAKKIAGTLAGFFSALFLALHPVFYGHMFNNPVDIPFGALFLTALYCMIAAYENLPRLKPKDLLFLGLSLGLMLAIRVGGMLIAFPCMLFGWFLWFLGQGFPHGKVTTTHASLKEIAREFIRNLAWIFGIAWPVMLVWWPWAQLDPFTRPFIGAVKAARWDFNTEMKVLFNGDYFSSFQLPKAYLMQSVLISLPEYFFIVLSLGAALAVIYIIRNPRLTFQVVQVSLLVFACLGPVLGSIFFKAPQFDGFRHFLFLIPLLAILGGLSFSAWVHSKINHWVKVVSICAVAFFLAMTALDMRRLHPYETVYFNRFLARGLAEAATKYETDYWGNSYREGILWVIKNYHPAFKRKIRVLNASVPCQTGYYLEKTQELRDRFEMVLTDPDIFLSTTRFGSHNLFPGKVLYKVERDHTPLLYVIEVSGK